MPSRLSSVEKVALGISVPVGLYGIILGLLLTPYFQRFALYAHKINTLFWHDIDDPTEFGFARNQVTPFALASSDGEALYAWHVLPLDVYTRNEAALRSEERANAVSQDIASSLAFKLLQAPDARTAAKEVHGNAGHIAQGWRTDTYRYLCTQPNTHVLTIDYRGFGKSTGSPTETGLITDAVALVDWVLDVAKVPPERIVLLGQSLGTAVASATALKFADPSHDLGLSAPASKDDETTSLIPQKAPLRQATTFAGVVLVAPFSSLPSLLLTYRIGGFLPVLLPLRPIPPLARFLTNQMTDKWPTADRLAAYYGVLANNPKLYGVDGRRMGNLEVIHAVNDFDISYHQTEMICRRMFANEHGDAGRCIDGSKGPMVLHVREDGRVGVRFEILEHGGHNRIVTYTPVAAAVLRAFEDLD